MKEIVFIIYKEWVEIKNNKRLILQLFFQSLLYGSVFPIISWLMMVGILPIDTPMQAEAIKVYLINFYPLLLPFFMTMLISLSTLPSVSSEVEHYTMERLFMFPILWKHIAIGKFFIYLVIGLMCSYAISFLYWILSFNIVSLIKVDYLLHYLTILVPAISFYTVSVSILISAKARNSRLATIYGGFLTWGLFLMLFFLSWVFGFKPDNIKLILTLSFLLVAAGLKSFYFALKINPEKLLIA